VCNEKKLESCQAISWGRKKQNIMTFLQLPRRQNWVKKGQKKKQYGKYIHMDFNKQNLFIKRYIF